jgi:hypothetical protein
MEKTMTKITTLLSPTIYNQYSYPDEKYDYIRLNNYRSAQLHKLRFYEIQAVAQALLEIISMEVAGLKV